MAKIIHGVIAFFWLVTTGILAYLTYVTIQTEANPQALWGWIVMCALTFMSATFLAYLTIYGGRRKPEEDTED